MATPVSGPAPKTCSHHPDRDARYVCLKHEVHLCEECRCCVDPELYCRHRTACVIHYMAGDDTG